VENLGRYKHDDQYTLQGSTTPGKGKPVPAFIAWQNWHRASTPGPLFFRHIFTAFGTACHSYQAMIQLANLIISSPLPSCSITDCQIP
jgi:hypothetical protein